MIDHAYIQSAAFNIKFQPSIPNLVSTNKPSVSVITWQNMIILPQVTLQQTERDFITIREPYFKFTLPSKM